MVTMTLYLVLLPIIGLVALAVVLFDAKHSPLDDSPLLIEMKMVAGQVIMFLQILGCISAANLSFGNPMTGALTSLAEPIDIDQFFGSTPCISSGFADAVAMLPYRLPCPHHLSCW
jgi:hypothetical protein